MSKLTDFITSIQGSANGISLAQLLEYHPDVARRTVQRWIKVLQIMLKTQMSGLTFRR